MNLVYAFIVILSDPSYLNQPFGVYDYCLDVRSHECALIVNAGQPESDEAIGTAWRVLKHPEQMERYEYRYTINNTNVDDIDSQPLGIEALFSARDPRDVRIECYPMPYCLIDLWYFYGRGEL